MVIAVAVGGGIGNQLFQYAAARALALRLGVPLTVDSRHFRGRTWPRYALDGFPIENAPIEESLLPPVRRDAWRRFRALFAGSRFTVFDETQFRFDESVLALSDWTYLRGYFQSEKYFADCIRELRRDLAFSPPRDVENRDVLSEIAATLAVSLHVRRGDYVTNPRANRVHGTIDAEFYRDAAALIAARCGATPTFFIFSDDPDWVSANLDIGFPVRVVRHNGVERAADDLRLMAACRHHILANSSFSWWGAWLNPSPEKIVVAPRRWFRDPAKDDSDLVPETWIRL